MPQASGFLPTPVQLPRVWWAGACGASARRSSLGPATAGKRDPCAPPLRPRPVPSQLHWPEVPGPRRRPAGLGPRDVAWIGAHPDHVQQRRRAGARPALGRTAGPGVPAHPGRPAQSGADGKKSGVAWGRVHGAAPGRDSGSTAHRFGVPSVSWKVPGAARRVPGPLPSPAAALRGPAGFPTETWGASSFSSSFLFSRPHVSHPGRGGRVPGCSLPSPGRARPPESRGLALAFRSLLGTGRSAAFTTIAGFPAHTPPHPQASEAPPKADG